MGGIVARLMIYTIGVYGSTKESFFNTLLDNRIDTFCDIRRRRAVRGSEYTYVNSQRLQDHLKKLNINYLHIPELSPSDEMRKLQYEVDKQLKTTQRQRQNLSENFIKNYKSAVLDNYDFDSLVEKLKLIDSQRTVLFCVEKFPSACHRSLVAEHLQKRYRFVKKDL